MATARGALSDHNISLLNPAHIFIVNESQAVKGLIPVVKEEIFYFVKRIG